MLKEVSTKNYLSTGSVSAGYLADKFTNKSHNDCLYYRSAEPIGFKIKGDVKPKLAFSVANLKFEFPETLRHIVDELEYSKYILDLNNKDWDDEGAKPIENELYLKVVKFLGDYSIHLFKNSCIIDFPEINPLVDGSIDLSWRSKQARLLINFKTVADGIIVKYYGDLYKAMSDISGSINIERLDFPLIEWMKQLRK